MTYRNDSTLLMNRMVAFELVASYLNQSTTVGRSAAIDDALVAEIKSKDAWRPETDEGYFQALGRAECAPADLLEHVLRRYGEEAE